MPPSPVYAANRNAVNRVALFSVWSELMQESCICVLGLTRQHLNSNTEAKPGEEKPGIHGSYYVSNRNEISNFIFTPEYKTTDERLGFEIIADNERQLLLVVLACHL